MHRAKKLLLSAFVDGYKMAGKRENIGLMWDLLRSNGLELEDAISVKSNAYLGCAQREVEPNFDFINAKCEMMSRLCLGSGSGTGKPVESSLSTLKEPSEVVTSKPKNKQKKKVRTPLKEPSDLASKDSPRAHTVHGRPEVSAYSYEMIGHVQQTVERYLELSGRLRKSLGTKAATPFIDDHQIPPEEFEVKGRLAPIAALRGP